MIISRAPLRISLGGGGTDLPSYYKEHAGFLVAAAINKYVYITLHDTFGQGYIIKYSQLERCATTDEIKHPIIREALRLFGIERAHLEITSFADIPAGTGLGSSGSFAVALIRALSEYTRRIMSPVEIAEMACKIEIELLKEHVGKQDQYIAAVGGITCFSFMPDGRVGVDPLQIASETLYNLEDHLLMFFTGVTRSASAILKDQNDKSKANDGAMIQNLHLVKELGRESERALLKGDLREFARLMDVHWENKRKRSGGMSNPRIDELYQLARANGALGGKVIGAGGGGFLMFYSEEQANLRATLKDTGLTELRFRFDHQGVRTVL